MLNTVHLRVLDQEPVYHEGYGFGCDYKWSGDYSYYTLMPHRWNLCDHNSYANYQAGTLPYQQNAWLEDE